VRSEVLCVQSGLFELKGVWVRLWYTAENWRGFLRRVFWTFMAGHSLKVINLDLFSAYITTLASEYTCKTRLVGTAVQLFFPAFLLS
jgi:hypothetical protein